MTPYELSDGELAELVDGYREYGLAEITMRAAQRKLLEHVHNYLKNLESIQHYGEWEIDMYDFILEDIGWQSLLKDFGIK